jgi:hypothetical protein
VRRGKRRWRLARQPGVAAGGLAGWRGNQGRSRLLWPAAGDGRLAGRRAAAVGGRVGRAHGAGAWGGWAATDGDAATGDGRPTVFRQRAGGTVGVEARGRERRRLFGREKERRKGIAD